MRILFIFGLLMYSVLGSSQSIGKWTVSAVSRQSSNDSLIITGGQPASAFTNSPTTFIGYLPLNYSLLSIDEEEFEFTLSPNPTSDFVILNFAGLSEGNFQAKIYDSQGRLVLASIITSGSYSDHTLSLAGLNAGVYLFVIESGETVVGSQQIIFEN